MGNIVIVGAGISGSVLAERYANILNKKVIIFEKRDHIGGNCYDFLNEGGILIPKYGPHFFHTNFEDVWSYINKFSEWMPYEHKVLSYTDGKLVSVPVNITTINKLFNLNIKTEEEMQDWLQRNTKNIRYPKNSEEASLSRVGEKLYEKLFKNYTKKQWDLWPKELDASVMNRIPVRTNFDDRYFSDKYQVMPKNGYTKMFEKMIDHPNIEVRLNKDYLDAEIDIKNSEKLFFTGPIDLYFKKKFGELQYRSLRFEYKTFDQEHFQSTTTINYPNTEEFTRITEPKHATKQKHNKTTIIKEYPTWKGEPYYPVPSKNNQDIFMQYQREVEKLERNGVYFVGRLANYKYFNMDQAFKNSLDLFDSLEL